MTASLWPANVELLRGRGVKFTHRAAGHDIVIEPCPICRKGKFILHEENPFFLCLGDLHCEVDRLNFDQVLHAIGRAGP